MVESEMSSLKTLSEACVPRKSVFDRSRKDVVLQLGDFLNGALTEDDAKIFFEENFVTNGLKSLVSKTFDRIVGVKDQASTFLLSQAMGGGKTHSMLALGFLAKYPALRKTCWKEGDLGAEPVRVIGFDGRESDYPFGIWGALADQLGKKDFFKDYFSPLQARGSLPGSTFFRDPPRSYFWTSFHHISPMPCPNPSGRAIWPR